MNDVKINKVTVVCPFFNESAIIAKAATGMIAVLRELSNRLKIDWELIAVNDGSRDDSLEEIERIFAAEPKARLISYSPNQGRGYALKTGINEATGDIVITTEIDLSWGEKIVGEIVDKFLANPHLDFIIASPHLPGGGYKNIPHRRVWLSRFGNALLRLLFTKEITMNTGMTRGYRREIIQELPTDERGKEFHIEVVFKLIMLGYRFAEIPATLEWRDEQLSIAGAKKRKSSFKTLKFIFSHLNFAAFVNPIRYFWGFSFICTIIGIAFMLFAMYQFAIEKIAIYSALSGISILIVALLFFGFGILSSQNNRILKELWKLQMRQRNNGFH